MTKSVGKFAGRWVPFVGWGLLIYDGVNFFSRAIDDLKLMDKNPDLHALKHKKAFERALKYGERE